MDNASSASLAEKAALRADLLVRREALSPEEAARRSRDVHSRVRALPAWANAHVVLVYLPFRNEVDTWGLIRELWSRGARTMAPCCRPACPGEMGLYTFQTVQDLRPGAYSILEPDPRSCALVDPQACECVLVPGVGFDRQGYRLGFGKGYYDRLLPRLRGDALIIGLAYGFQVVDALPREAHDQSVRVVCTDMETIWPGSV